MLGNLERILGLIVLLLALLVLSDATGGGDHYPDFSEAVAVEVTLPEEPPKSGADFLSLVFRGDYSLSRSRD